MQAKWSSFLCLILLACFVESSSGQQSPNFDGSQNRSLPPIVQAREFRFSQRQIQAPQQPAYQQPAYQQSAYQQPAYQQPAYQQPAYQRNIYQQAANPTATQQPGASRTPAYQEAREQSVLQATYPQAQNSNQYGAVEQRGTVDAQAMLLEERWQQFRSEQTARLAARQIPPAQPLSQTNQPQYRPNVAPAYQPAPKNPYSQQSYVRRQTPAYPAGMTQTPQEQDPFGNIEDPFGDPSAAALPLQRPQDPGGTIVEELDPSGDPLPQQTDPFEEPQRSSDPFADQLSQNLPPQDQTTQDQPRFQDPFADETVPDVKPEQQPMQEPTPPVQEPPLAPPPAEPTLPGGRDDVPQIPGEMRQAPVPPMPEPELPQLQPEPPAETYPPEAVIPPVEPQEEAAPDEPSPAPQTPEARLMQPVQLYPGQIPPAALPTPTSTPQRPINPPKLDSNVGSPGPYMPQAVPTPYIVQPSQQPMLPTQPYPPSSFSYPQMAPVRPTVLQPLVSRYRAHQAVIRQAFISRRSPPGLIALQ